MQKKYLCETSKIPFEEALSLTGHGTYNHLLVVVTGLTIVSFALVSYSSSIMVPASACELETSSAQQGLLAAAPLIGSIIGAFVWGYLGDTRGRRRMLVVSLLLSILFNTTSSVSVHWSMLMVFQFFATMMACGKYTLSLTLLSESVSIQHRNKVVLLVSSIFLLSQGIMAALAIPIIPLEFSYYLPALDIHWNSWRTLLVVYSVPSVFCLLFLLFVHESPKFLLMKGEDEKALYVLRSMYRTNNRNAKEDFNVKGLIPESSKIQGVANSKLDQILPLFKAPLLKNTVIIISLFLLQQVGAFVIWLPTVANQFTEVLTSGAGSELPLCGVLRLGLETPPDVITAPCSLNVFALLIVLAVGVFQSAVNLLVTVIIHLTGRRYMVMILTVTISTCGILCNLVPSAVASALFYLVFLLGIIITGPYNAITVALFPTHLRAMAVSLTAVASRLGTFVSLQVVNYLLRTHCEAGFYVFASMFMFSAVVVSFLPADRIVKPSTNTEIYKTRL